MNTHTPPREYPFALALLTPYGAFTVVLDHSDPNLCPLCHNARILRVDNPELTDGLTRALAPLSQQTLTLDCPACRPSDRANNRRPVTP